MAELCCSLLKSLSHIDVITVQSRMSRVSSEAGAYNDENAAEMSVCIINDDYEYKIFHLGVALEGRIV